MKKWLDTFIDEKGFDRNMIFEVNGESGLNLIPLEVVIEHINITTLNEKQAIKKQLIKLDFMNYNVLDYFNYLAKAIAK